MVYQNACIACLPAFDGDYVASGDQEDDGSGEDQFYLAWDQNLTRINSTEDHHVAGGQNLTLTIDGRGHINPAAKIWLDLAFIVTLLVILYVVVLKRCMRRFAHRLGQSLVKSIVVLPNEEIDHHVGEEEGRLHVEMIGVEMEIVNQG